jgi:hypothetical protein
MTIRDPFPMRVRNIFICSAGNNRIRKITPAGVVTTLAGSGASGFADGTGVTAQFSDPKGVTVDATGNLYVSDAVNTRIQLNRYPRRRIAVAHVCWAVELLSRILVPWTLVSAWFFFPAFVVFWWRVGAAGRKTANQAKITFAAGCSAGGRIHLFFASL